MFARLTTTVIGPHEHDSPADIVDRILPTLKGLAGFKGVLVLLNEEARVIHGMTLWDSAEAMEKSEAVVGGIRRAESVSREIVSQDVNTFRVVALHLDGA